MKAKVLKEWLLQIPDEAVIEIGIDDMNAGSYNPLEQDNIRAVIEGPGNGDSSTSA